MHSWIIPNAPLWPFLSAQATDPTNYSLHTVVCVTREGSKRKKSLSLSLQSHRKGLCSDASSNKYFC